MDQNSDESECSGTDGICYGLNQFRKENIFCDIKLDVGHKIYPCHKVVISTSSKYFHVMLNSSFKEKDTHLIELKSDDIDPDVFDEIMEFLYISDIKFTKKNVYGLLKTSHYLQIEELENRCCDYIMSNPKVENIFEICEYLEKIGYNDCLDNVIKHTFVQMKNWKKSENFLNLSHTLLVSILEHARHSNPMRQLMNMIFDWIDFNWADRKDYLRDLLRIVIPSNDLTIPFFEKISDRLSIENKNIYSPSLGIFCALKSNLFYINELIYKNGSFAWKKINEHEGEKTVKVTRHEQFNYFFSVTDESNFFWRNWDYRARYIPPFHTVNYDIITISDAMYLYDYSAQFHLYEDRRDANAFKNGNRIFTYYFDLDLWFTVPLIPEELYHSYLATIDGMIYLIGGTKQHSFKTEKKHIMQCYEKRSPKWIKKKTDEKFNLHGTVCVHQNEIWIYEKNSRTNKNQFYIYNSTAGKFRSPMTTEYPFATSAFLISFNDELWLIEKKLPGGIYRNLQNEWEELGETPLQISTPEGCQEIHKIINTYFY